MHVDGAADALRRLGHEVTVLAPSSRARDLVAGRRALQRDAVHADVIAVGPSIPLSRRTNMGVPVAVRANLRLALTRGRFDVVHGFEPGLPSLSYLALTSAHTLTAATFFSIDRLVYPASRSRRDRLRTRVDALLATSEETAEAAAERFEGDYGVIPVGVDLTRFQPTRSASSWPSSSRSPAARRHAPSSASSRAPRTGRRPFSIRSHSAFGLRYRDGCALESTCVRHARARSGRKRSLPRRSTSRRREERSGSRSRQPRAGPRTSTDPPTEPSARSSVSSPTLDVRAAMAQAARTHAESQSFDAVGAELDAVYSKLVRKRRVPRSEPDDPLADRDWITIDLHLHTEWSHDCSIPTEDVLDHAEAIGLGGIAVTDHNVFGGALEAVELARTRDLVVVPGEEIKTDNQGEVIGLFLEEEIPRGMTFADTIAAIREQGGLVYLPHPFDRLHSIPDPATIHRHLAEIDVFEVYNARLLRDSFNDEALRFARKYGLLQGAGSDAHVLQGLGTGAVRMRRFDGPEEFLLSLRTAEILRRPKSLAYLQSLKWVAQVKEKVL